MAANEDAFTPIPLEPPLSIVLLWFNLDLLFRAHLPTFVLTILGLRSLIDNMKFILHQQRKTVFKGNFAHFDCPRLKAIALELGLGEKKLRLQFWLRKNSLCMPAWWPDLSRTGSCRVSAGISAWARNRDRRIHRSPFSLSWYLLLYWPLNLGKFVAIWVSADMASRSQFFCWKFQNRCHSNRPCSNESFWHWNWIC